MLNDGIVDLSVGVMKVEDFSPTFDHVLARPLRDGETAGGIATPDGVHASGVPRLLVVAVGPGRTELGVFVETNIKVGDIVAISHNQMYPPLELTFSGIDHVLVKERDVIGVIGRGK